MVQLYLSREKENNGDEGKEREKVEYPTTAKKMLGEEDEAEGGESDNQGDDGEAGFGGSGHDNEDVSNWDNGSDNDSGHGQEMLALKTPVYKGKMAKFG